MIIAAITHVHGVRAEHFLKVGINVTISSALSSVNKLGFLCPLISKLSLTQHWERFAAILTKCSNARADLSAKGDRLYCLYQFPEENNTGNLSCIHIFVTIIKLVLGIFFGRGMSTK